MLNILPMHTWTNTHTHTNTYIHTYIHTYMHHKQTKTFHLPRYLYTEIHDASVCIVLTLLRYMSFLLMMSLLQSMQLSDNHYRDMIFQSFANPENSKGQKVLMFCLEKHWIHDCNQADTVCHLLLDYKEALNVTHNLVWWLLTEHWLNSTTRLW